MAIIKAPKSGKRKSLSAAIKYAAKEVDNEKDIDKLCRGINCSNDPKEAYQQMMATKEQWGKTDGRQHKHYVQSFKPGEIDKNNPKVALEVAEKTFAEKFPGHEVFLSAHLDKGHIHVHAIINSVNFENGHKLSLHKSYLEQIKERSDEICKEHGLSTIDRSVKPERGEIRAYNTDNYQTLKKAADGKYESFVMNAAMALSDTLEQEPVSKNEFSKLMQERGWKVDYRGEKHITLTDLRAINDKKPHKVRVDNLAKTFNMPQWSRQGIEKSISANMEKCLSTPTQIKTVNQIQQDTKSIGAEAKQIMKGADTPSHGGGGGGAGGGRDSEDLVEKLMAQGMSREKAEEIARESEESINIQLGGINTDSVWDDLKKIKKSIGMER